MTSRLRLFFLFACMVIVLVPRARAEVVLAEFSSAADVPVTAAGYTATGNTLRPYLYFVPAMGTSLTVVKNTGTGFIEGAFSNLVQGQTVTLDYQGTDYVFVANYYGGSGNDLVLQWKNVQVMAWGQNNYGQLGRADNYGVLLSPRPVTVAGALEGKTVLSLSVGQRTSLALCSDGTIAAWGSSDYGNIANSTQISWAVPMTGALAGKTVAAVSAGGYSSSSFNLALCSDGTVAAWGYNSNGQLGCSTPAYLNKIPVAVDTTGVLAGKTVVAISAGAQHSLALCSDGTVVAWGNDYGAMPVVMSNSGVLAGKTVTAIATGYFFNLALCSDGTVAAWGSINSSGQFGNNSTFSNPVPVAVSREGVLAGRTVTAIAAGYAHSLALCSDGTLAAWGWNGGQLGNNSTAASSVPVSVDRSGVLAGKTVVTIAGGRYHSMAGCADGTMVAWGYGGYGGLGDNTGITSSVPVAVSTVYLGLDDRLVTATTGEGATHCLGLVATPNPRIDVSGNGAPILSGEALPDAVNGTDFGTAALTGAQVTRTFTITNGGGGLLFPGDPVITGDAAADFVVTQHPAPALAAGASTTFTITYDPSLPALRTAMVHLANNDPVRPNFSFFISCNSPLPVKRPQTITFTPPATLYLGQVPYFFFNVVSSSGLPVTLSRISGGGEVRDNGLTQGVAGVIKVQATSPGDDRYAAAPPITRTITVKADPATLMLTELTQRYDSHPKPVTAFGAGSDQAVISYKVGGKYVPDAPSHAGSYPVRAVAGARTATGTLVITKAPLFAIADDKHKYAGQANPPLTVSYSGFAGGDTASLITKAPVLMTTATTASPGGVYPITISGGATVANYTLICYPGNLVVETFAGAYEALLQDAYKMPTGKLSITVAATNNTFTAKLAEDKDLTAVSFTGPLVMAGNGQATGTAKTNVFDNKVAVAYVINFTLPPYGKVTASAKRGSLAAETATDGRKLSTRPVLYAGAHTAILEPTTTEYTSAPRAAGWATVNAGTTGILTFVGKLGDGTAFTTTINPDDQGDPGYRLFVQPYLPGRKFTFLAGTFALAPHPTLPNRRYLAPQQQPMTWRKLGLPADPSYPSGFSFQSTALTIDPWLPPVAATKTVTAVTLAQRLGISGSNSFGVSHSDTGNFLQNSLPTRLGLSATNTVSVLVPLTTPLNITKWQTLTLVPATGTFTGNFELVDESIPRTVTFSGVLRQPATIEDNVIGHGHYLQPVSETEKTAGDIFFSRTP